MKTEPDKSHLPETTSKGPAAAHRGALFDCLWICLGCLATYFVARSFDIWERSLGSLQRLAVWETWELDELLIVALLTPAACAAFAYRRSRDLKSLLHERDAYIRSLEVAHEAIEESRSTLRSQAITDRLTGLANRACLLEHMESLLERVRAGDDTMHAVLYFDVDNFKRVNDTYGHQTGDALLRGVASRMASHLREEHTLLARPGGDEFVVVLGDLKQAVDAENAAIRVLDSLNAPFVLGAASVTAGASVGVVLVNDGYASAADLLRDADMAMYEAKRLGRGRFTLFDAAIRERLQRRLRLETDLREAIARQELSLVYQPIVSLSTGALVGVEALLRWKHAEFGPVGPAEFIPIAEESDLILDIGAWVLRQGCRQMADWLRNFPTRAPGVMSLNVSRRQFSQPNLSELIGAVIREERVPADRIQVEITEDTYVGDVATAIRIMQDIKAQGVKLAIDDFGVGTSTLAAVQQFPIDVLKVDRSLVSETASSADSAAILHSLAVLVRNLDVKLVAEGIEEVEQVIALQELGCQYGQGYLFGRPMAPEAIAEMFAGSPSFGLTASGASAFGNSWEHRLAAFQRLELEEASRAPAKASAAALVTPAG